MKKSPLQLQIVLFLVITLLSLWGFTFYVAQRAKQQAIAEAELRTRGIAHAYAEHALSTIKRIDGALKQLAVTWASRPQDFDFDIRRIEEAIADISIQVAVTDREGTMVYSNLGLPKVKTSVADREHIRVHFNTSDDKLFISKPILGRVSGKWSIQFTRPILRNGIFNGVIVISVSPGLFSEFHETLASVGQDVATMFRDSGEIMARTPDWETYIGQVLKSAPFLDDGAPGNGSYRKVAQTDGVERLYGFYRLPEYHLVFVAGTTAEQVLEPIKLQHQASVGIAAVLSMLLIVLAWGMRRSLQAQQVSQAQIHALNHQLEERITQRTAELEASQRIESALQESEGKLRQLIDTLPGMVWTTTPDGTLEFISPQWLSYTGTTEEETRKTTGFNCVHPDDRDKLVRAWQSALAERAGFKALFRLRRHDGTFRWFKSRGGPLLDRDGRVFLWLGVMTDAHDLMTAQDALIENERRLAVALQASGSAVWELEVQSGIVHGDGLLFTMLGYSPGDLKTATDWLSLIHEEDSSGIPGQMNELIEGHRESYRVELRCRTKAGSWRWILSQAAAAERDSVGRATRLIGTHTDIHERRQMEAALREREALFKGLTETQPGFVFVTDPEGMAIYLNAACAAYTGRPVSEMLGEGWQEALHPDDADYLVTAWQNAVAEGTAHQIQFRFRRYDSAYRWFLCRSTPVRCTESGRIERWIGVIIDINDQKAAEAEVLRLNAELEQRVAKRTAELTAANRELEGFTFATSHDLKGPLGRINSFSSLLEQRYRDQLEGEGLVLLDFIRQNAIRLNQLVDDLLKHARAAQQTLELRPVNVRALVQAVLQEKFVEISVAGANIEVDLPPVEVMGDSYALEQALSNLLGNALKYSALDRVPVIQIGGQERDGHLRLWVRDNGIGFEMAYHDKIFEIFGRLHTYAQYEGSGIGLALVKRAMERMGGRVWAESEPGQGAVFYLEIQTANQFEKPALAS